MDSDSLLQNADYLRQDQYKDSLNLGNRAQLHRRYGSNPTGWFEWVMAHIALEPGTRLLECGCGPGWLWRENLGHLPSGCQITLTDLSPGMVTEAENALSQTGTDFRFLPVDVAKLPFDSQSFDVVIANHMLYHVPNREQALAEIERILKPDGRFLAATVGKNHMIEIRDIAKQLVPEFASSYNESSRGFSLENGRDQLVPYFAQIDMFRYENCLKVTEIEPLLAYVLSSSEARSEVDSERLRVVRRTAQERMERQDSFDITTDSGMFIAKGKQ